MGTQSPITGPAITDVLKAKVQHAYNAPPTGPFTVENIQTHKADVTFSVLAYYSTKIVRSAYGTAVRNAYSQDGLQRTLAARDSVLLQDGAEVYRERMQGRMAADYDLYKKEKTFALLRDDQKYYCNETCDDCSGRGTCNCSTCSGSAKVRCTSCSGDGRVACRSCNGYPTAGKTCGYCSNAGKITCDHCGGYGRRPCTSCNSGQVRCNTCKGTCELSYQYQLDVYAQTSVSYAWAGEIPNWMDESLKRAVKDPEMASVFRCSSYETISVVPMLFTGKGHAIGTEATVGYQGAVGNCRFLGESIIPVYLDGVLSGDFQKSIDGVSDATKISNVGKASRNNIARELIAEVENGRYYPAISTPVQRGVISRDQAEIFIAGRANAKTYIKESQKKFNLGRIFQFSLRLTLLFFFLYLAANIAADFKVYGLTWKQVEILSIIDAFQNPMLVFQTFMRPFDFMLEQFQNSRYPIHALWFPICAIIFNKFALPLLFPRLWDWNKSKMKSLVLSIPGMVILALLLAVFPASYSEISLRNLTLYTSVMNVWMTFEPIVEMVPKIWGWALIIALIRYPAAGQYWARRMYRKLSPKS